MIDRTYGHLARDSEDSIRERLNARSRDRKNEAAISGKERGAWPA
jgi:hypothetical protein